LKNNPPQQLYDSDETFLKFWAAEIEKQNSISKQLEESEKSMTRESIEKTKQIEESEKKFLQLFEEIVGWIKGTSYPSQN